MNVMLTAFIIHLDIVPCMPIFILYMSTLFFFIIHSSSLCTITVLPHQIDQGEGINVTEAYADVSIIKTTTLL